MPNKWLCLFLYTYVESWLNEAQPNRIPKSPAPLGPSISSPVSIPISSDLLPALRPGLEVWDRLLFFAWCRRSTASMREKSGPALCSECEVKFRFCTDSKTGQRGSTTPEMEEKTGKQKQNKNSWQRCVRNGPLVIGSCTKHAVAAKYPDWTAV